jgi:hypothetical protein
MMDDVLTRQMVRQWLPRRVAPLGCTGCRRRRRDPFCLAFLKVFEQQLELLDLGVQLGTSINSAEHRAGRLSGRCDASDAAVAAGSGRF